MRIRHAFVAAAVAAASALTMTTTAAAAAPAAPANARSCNWIYIGTGAGIHIGGQYVGQVVQLYNNCGTAEAHFQWDETYRQTHNTRVYVDLEGPWGKGRVTASGPTSSKNVDAYVDIHSASPDQWGTYATVNNCMATGTMHDYANGGTLWESQDAWC
ncbi:hypothetical protein AB0D08_14755 [Kitasatospora sp. NPDC048540]|uniref:hypothetical protein n=1 Tax=Kitasatospora sp. NPDC048540 TaxID=3155634 RepID=UPI0033E505EF